MPGPDPSGLYLDEYDDGSWTIGAEIWEYGNRRARIARMLAVARRIRLTGWRCYGCDELVPLYKRADAKYCREGCRKQAAKRRRLARKEVRNWVAMKGR